jgi:ribonuclease HI
VEFKVPPAALFVSQLLKLSLTFFLNAISPSKSGTSSTSLSPIPPPPLSENWNDLFISWKQRYVGSFKNKKQFTLLWRQIPKFVCWELWLARNQAIFHEKLPPVHNIFAKICGLVAEVFKTKAIGFDLPGVLEQSEEEWVNYIRGPPTTPLIPPRQKPKRKEWQLRLNNNDFSHWQRQQHTSLLFFDGATTGNPGVAGAGGVIYDSDGQKVADFSWGLGKTTNNRAETLAVYMGLKLAHERSIQTLTVIGDSEIVIKDLRGLSTSANHPPNGLCSRINTLKHHFTSLRFFHTLCAQNTEADNLAKAVKSLEQSHLVINQASSYDWLP